MGGRKVGLVLKIIPGYGGVWVMRIIDMNPYKKNSADNMEDIPILNYASLECTYVY
jgi:hypothetical protein